MSQESDLKVVDYLLEIVRRVQEGEISILDMSSKVEANPRLYHTMLGEISLHKLAPRTLSFEFTYIPTEKWGQAATAVLSSSPETSFSEMYGVIK